MTSLYVIRAVWCEVLALDRRFTELQVRIGQRMAYRFLHLGEGELCGCMWPAIETMMAEAEASERAVQTTMRKLVEWDYLEVVRQGGGRQAGEKSGKYRGKSTVYLMTLPAGSDTPSFIAGFPLAIERGNKGASGDTPQEPSSEQPAAPNTPQMDTVQACTQLYEEGLYPSVAKATLGATARAREAVADPDTPGLFGFDHSTFTPTFVPIADLKLASIDQPDNSPCGRIAINHPLFGRLQDAVDRRLAAYPPIDGEAVGRGDLVDVLGISRAALGERLRYGRRCDDVNLLLCVFALHGFGPMYSVLTSEPVGVGLDWAAAKRLLQTEAPFEAAAE